jgi:hypothetical protein
LTQHHRWTGPELELAARQDLTALQVANAVGRTEAAVRTIRRKIRRDPRKANLAGVPRKRGPIKDVSVESWGVTVDEAQAMLRDQMCPVCGMGPWKSPLHHASHAHGIDGNTMRDICGLSMRDKVTDPEVGAAWTDNSKRMIDILAANAEARKGTTFAPRKTLRYRARVQCTVDGCDKPHDARGYCRHHLRRWKLYGDPLGKFGRLTDEQERQAIDMIATGMTQRAVGEHFGRSQSAISHMLKRHGLV